MSSLVEEEDEFTGGTEGYRVVRWVVGEKCCGYQDVRGSD